jgi:hypothetical protein
MREGVRGDAGDVPEEVEVGDTLEAGQTGESLVSEWAVDQKARTAGVFLEHRKVVQQREARIGDEFSRAEVAEVEFALQGGDGAIAGGRTLTSVPRADRSLQMSDARIGDTGLPGHFEFAEVGQVPQNFKTSIGELAAGELTQIQVFQLRHSGEVQQTVVREFARPAEAEGSDVIQGRKAGKCGVRHQSVGIQGGDATLAHYADQLIPLRRCHATAGSDAVFLGVDHVGRALRRRAGCLRRHEGIPASEAGVLRNDHLGFGKLQRVYRHPERTLRKAYTRRQISARTSS